MRHRYECPMRWADLDMLGHVNNVTYVDYLQEARVDMLRVHARSPMTDPLAEGVLVASHQVTYLEPLLFDHAPVYVDVWVTEIRAASFTMAYEIFREGPADEHGVAARTVYLRASSVLTPYLFAEACPRRLTPDERSALEVYLHPEAVLHPHRIEVGEARPTELGHYPVKVRFSDVDVYGHVNNVKFFEYFQEGRIAMMARLREQGSAARDLHIVVAQADMAFRAPMEMRPEPYDLHVWVARVGSKSLVFDGEIVDHAGESPLVLARSRVVLVFFDLATGRSVAPPEDVRTALEALTREP
ncbi:acyl-CoA thioesterase [Nocardioides nematodiphilus]|uniref:acyl-CoA thioesterase n=1 Tax=Nocardioides nematodiphilus TaxID=2849669 RepID=UPI001CDA3D46|nr:thioesterase family protein [Nocardioides nematodiphilus]MCA1983614.1 acyl-CoA thioesterase [Nocardioides nematodiphilus]